MISADSDALSRAFSNEADVLARQVLVTARCRTPSPAEEATVAVTLGSDVGDLSAEAFTPIGNGPAAPVVPCGPRRRPTDGARTPPGSTAGSRALGLGVLVVLVAIAPRRQSR